MKQMVLALFLVCAASSVSAGVFDWQVKGFLEGSFYPPHNEFDPNPGIAFPDRVVARYGFEFYCEIHPKDAPRLFVFMNPRVYFGDSRPQTSYNYQGDPIVANQVYGVGYVVGHHTEVRLTHGEWKNLGGYKLREKLGWNAVQVRYNFGNQ